MFRTKIGIKNEDWIQYDMHMCFHELLYRKIDSNEIILPDETEEQGHIENSMSWLKTKLSRVDTIVSEINFFTLPVYPGHLLSLQEEYPNIRNIYLDIPTRPWMNPVYCNQHRIDKFIKSISLEYSTFTIHNTDAMYSILNNSAHEDLDATSALRLLDFAMNFFWREENMHDGDYFDMNGTVWTYWFSEIKTACPAITDDYLSERMYNNIKLRKNFI